MLADIKKKMETDRMGTDEMKTDNRGFPERQFAKAWVIVKRIFFYGSAVGQLPVSVIMKYIPSFACNALQTSNRGMSMKVRTPFFSFFSKKADYLYHCVFFFFSNSHNIILQSRAEFSPIKCNIIWNTQVLPAICLLYKRESGRFEEWRCTLNYDTILILSALVSELRAVFKYQKCSGEQS